MSAIILDKQTFDRLYWASKDPRLHQIVGDEKQAAQLAIQGLQVDVPIMVWGWDPFLVMMLRQSFGFTWVPAGLQPNITIAPGLGEPGATPYDPAHPPAGSIKVSLDSADYPPFTPPAAPSPAPVVGYVGIDELGGFFAANQPAADAFFAGTLKDGQEYDADPRGKFIFHASRSPFAQANHGWTFWFTKE